MTFDTIKQRLLEAPALGLRDINKGIAKGVLTHTIRPWKRPVAYLPKKLDSVATGWPPCLRIIVAVALLVRDADNPTLGQTLEVCTHMLWNLF